MRGFVGVAVAVTLMAVAASATAETNTLTVSANVIGTCKFTTPTSTLAFGNLDPSLGGNVNGLGSASFWCTKGVTELFSAGQGTNWNGTSRQMIGPGGDLIPYSLTLAPDGLSNAGPNLTRTLAISGTIVGTDYAGKAAGSYSDTVTITLTP